MSHQSRLFLLSIAAFLIFKSFVAIAQQDTVPPLSNGNVRNEYAEEPQVSRDSIEPSVATLVSVASELETRQIEVERDSYDGVATLIAALALILGIINLGATFLFRRYDKHNSIIDVFWLREIIIPQVVRPLNSMLLKNKFRFKVQLNNQEIRDFIESMDNLKISLGLVSIISNDLVKVIEETIDGLSLNVVNRSNPQLAYAPTGNSNLTFAKDPYLDCYQTLVRKLAAAHKTASAVL